MFYLFLIKIYILYQFADHNTYKYTMMHLITFQGICYKWCIWSDKNYFFDIQSLQLAQFAF